jgi:N-acetylmuramoyl-L-alanine amidase
MKRSFVLALSFLLLAFPAHAATTSVTQLQAKYQTALKGGEKVKVLIVPGHEPGFGGTDYQGVYERDVNVAIAQALAAQLKTDPRLSVTVARDGTSWNAALTDYFAKEWDSIGEFIQSHKAQTTTTSDVSSSGFQASHNTAPTDVATRLYGITKWANENGIDLAIHVHLNDSGDFNQSGFAIYVPDASFGNAVPSQALGVKIANELNRYNATSSLAIENLGVTADKDLIAVGAYNTANFPSVLVEYSYIYEGKIQNPAILPLAERDFANSTYRGIERFFGRPVAYYDTLALPHRFTGSPAQNTTSAEVYSLQQGLRRLNLYPPGGGYFYDCPVGGYFGDCTISALKAFQKSKGIEQTGTLGPRTRAALNAYWGGK